MKNRKAVVGVSKNIVQLLDASLQGVRDHRFTPAQVRGTLNAVLDLGIRGEFRDYAGAEQAVMAIDVLNYSQGVPDRSVETKLARLYDIVRDDDRYPPAALVKEFESLRTVVLKR